MKPVWLNLEKASVITMLIDSKGVLAEEGGGDGQVA